MREICGFNLSGVMDGRIEHDEFHADSINIVDRYDYKRHNALIL